MDGYCTTKHRPCGVGEAHFILALLIFERKRGGAGDKLPQLRPNTDQFNSPVSSNNETHELNLESIDVTVGITDNVSHITWLTLRVANVAVNLVVLALVCASVVRAHRNEVLSDVREGNLSTIDLLAHITILMNVEAVRSRGTPRDVHGYVDSLERNFFEDDGALHVGHEPRACDSRDRYVAVKRRHAAGTREAARRRGTYDDGGLDHLNYCQGERVGTVLNRAQDLRYSAPSLNEGSTLPARLGPARFVALVAGDRYAGGMLYRESDPPCVTAPGGGLGSRLTATVQSRL